MIIKNLKLAGIGLGTLLVLYGGYSLASHFIRLPNPLVASQMAALQGQVDTLSASNAEARVEVEDAKKQAAIALQKAKQARFDINRYRTQAEAWKGQYEIVVTQRDALAKAVTGEEALRELKKLGWLR